MANSTKTTEKASSSALDTVLLIVALALLVGGIFGFYYFESQAIAVVRAIGLLVAMAAAILVAAQTHKGRALLGFLKNADIERRKVVWPTRQETMQTTLIVLVVTLIVSLILFGFDTMFSWGVRALMGGGA